MASMQKFVQALLMTQTSCRQAIQRKMRAKQIDISFEMIHILRFLSTHHQVSQQELASKSFRDKSSLSYLIKNMEKRGILFREESGSDRRSKLISLTDKGRELWSEVREAIDEVYLSIEQKADIAQIEMCVSHLEEISLIVKSN